MIFSRNLFLFAFTTATTNLTMASSSGVDSLDDVDIYRASNPRPPFHDDAEMLNTVLEISLKTSFTLPESSLVSCESLSIQELDERLIFMESIKSKELDSMYKDEDYRKNPYQNVNDLQSKIEEVNNDDGDIFLEEDFQRFMKCRELVTSYVHRLSESNKQIYLKSKSLPKLCEIDNEVGRRTLEEDDRRHRLLCFGDNTPSCGPDCGPTPAPTEWTPNGGRYAIYAINNNCGTRMGDSVSSEFTLQTGQSGHGEKKQKVDVNVDYGQCTYVGTADTEWVTFMDGVTPVQFDCGTKAKMHENDCNLMGTDSNACFITLCPGQSPTPESPTPGPTPAPTHRVLYDDSEPTPAPLQAPELSSMGMFPTRQPVDVDTAYLDDDCFQEEGV